MLCATRAWGCHQLARNSDDIRLLACHQAHGKLCSSQPVGLISPLPGTGIRGRVIPSQQYNGSPRHRLVIHAVGTEVAVALLDSPLRDAVCTGAAIVGAYAWVKLFNCLAQRRVLEQKLSRKMVHMTAGPLFVLTWPLFSASPDARLFAGVVPTLQFVRLLALGNGWLKDESAVKAVSREGSPEELLRGPLYYVLVLFVAVMLSWRDSHVGVTAISLMCAGDGMADIVGRRMGGAKLPFNKQKSWAGSIAMLVSGSAMSFGFIALFQSQGYFLGCDTITLQVLASALVATICEALPVTNFVDDNIIVPLAVAITSMAVASVL
mmetsp:Transcript_13690/g.38768  ORF Transcript_13690/g.38768 Transcript_13690/m.38768 type:complete len:322 (+) Transcript_13690:263-1228(+)|eukprot:CAMPEP_0117659820 /NCGR_PEP_ID=MMETSP0804-20121206/6634_1 /TAXON_ID=1074897 /ORGANISM="Tetraselmis astigmatica, Strain CCMP880" /LENGTH=321 /DNA_ID=CAMNT_0005466499 /DNA_START=167 /DNA_END=1132 /DNA_ORIENTATION=+